MNNEEPGEICCPNCASYNYQVMSLDDGDYGWCLECDTEWFIDGNKEEEEE